jgi:hypothetical protein
VTFDREEPMFRMLAALVSAGALAAAGSAAAATIEPPPPPFDGQVICVTCPPNYGVSVEGEIGPLGPMWIVRITNRGGPAATATTASVRYRWAASFLTTYTVSIPVPALGIGESRVVFSKPSTFYRLLEACADSENAIVERIETDNCI